MAFLFNVPPAGYVFPPWKDAFVESCQVDLPNSWSTGAAYNARMRVGPSRCKSWASVEVKARFRVVYERFCDDILLGVALPRKCFVRPYVVMPAAVNHVAQVPVVRAFDREGCSEKWKEIKALLGAKQG